MQAPESLRNNKRQVRRPFSFSAELLDSRDFIDERLRAGASSDRPVSVAGKSFSKRCNLGKVVTCNLENTLRFERDTEES